MTIFWLEHILMDWPSDLVASGKTIDRFLPEDVRGFKELQARALVVRKCEMLPVECVVRGYLTESNFKNYQQTGQVCGHYLPEDLWDSARLSYPIFTLITKATNGCDVDLPEDAVLEEYGYWLKNRSIDFYNKAAQYAKSRGIIIADTKFECGTKRELVDEILTPGSSHFWDLEKWKECAEKQSSPPPALDKQTLRDWGEIMDINKLNPQNKTDKAKVAAMLLPQNILEKTSSIYHEIFERLTGLTLGKFQKEVMKID